MVGKTGRVVVTRTVDDIAGSLKPRDRFFVIRYVSLGGNSRSEYDAMVVHLAQASHPIDTRLEILSRSSGFVDNTVLTWWSRTQHSYEFTVLCA